MGAQFDRMGHRYQMALAKHRWFFRHALDHDPSMTGVRLSFELMEWKQLGDEYPPALDALHDVRDAALSAVMADSAVETQFADFLSINWACKDEVRTRNVFVSLDATRPELARRLFRWALPALVRNREYELCGRYLQPRQDFERAREDYEEGWDPLTNALARGFREQIYTNKVTLLISLLAVNHRPAEAEEIAALARATRRDEKLAAAIDSALAGHVPEPIP